MYFHILLYFGANFDWLSDGFGRIIDKRWPAVEAGGGGAGRTGVWAVDSKVHGKLSLFVKLHLCSVTVMKCHALLSHRGHRNQWRWTCWTQRTHEDGRWQQNQSFF